MKSRTENLLPFDIYMYDFIYQSCQWDIIEPSMIYRPAILMPCCDRSNGFNASSFNYQMAKNLRLWIIPYRIIDVNGYDIGDVDEPELVEMESTFMDINASMERIDQNEESSDEDNWGN